MARNIDLKGIQDVRWPIVGDSYYWEGIHPRDQITRVTIHHSASDNPDFDAYAIANYHVNNLGWGGIGYHFVIKQDGIIQYAGDIDSWRAHTGNQNWGNIGICLMGNFTSHHPTDNQLSSVRKLLNYLFTQCPDIPNLVSFDQVKPHRFYGGTACPGDTYQQWWHKLNPSYKEPQPVKPEPIQKPESKPIQELKPEPILEPKPEPQPVALPEKPEKGKVSLLEMLKVIIKDFWGKVKEKIWKRK